MFGLIFFSNLEMKGVNKMTKTKKTEMINFLKISRLINFGTVHEVIHLILHFLTSENMYFL